MKKKYLKLIGVAALILCLMLTGSWLLWRQVYYAKASNRFVPLTAPPRVSILPATDQTVSYSTKLLFMGDTMLARTIGQGIVAGDNPYEYVQNTLDDYNFRMANMETTIAEPSVSVQAIGKPYTFNAPLAAIQILKDAHIDVAGLANNHTGDFGPAAMANMIDNLQAAGIKVAGAGKNINQAFTPLIVNVPAVAVGKVDSKTKTETVRLAIIAVNSIENSYTNATSTSAGSAFFDKARIVTEIQTARQTDKADIIIVFPHWGIEYQSAPTSEQISWGHFFIDSGADIVIGSHPHVIQSTEDYQGKYIVYSLGNFIFDGMSGNALNGQMVSLTINVADKLTSTSNGKVTLDQRNVSLASPQTIPVQINAQGYPELN